LLYFIITIDSNHTMLYIYINIDKQGKNSTATTARAIQCNVIQIQYNHNRAYFDNQLSCFLAASISG